jgi:hypothetical protein
MSEPASLTFVKECVLGHLMVLAVWDSNMHGVSLMADYIEHLMDHQVYLPQDIGYIEIPRVSSHNALSRFSVADGSTAAL